MAERKKFLLRVDQDVFDAVQRWADDELRSVNAQVEFALRQALRAAGRPVRRAAREATRTDQLSEAGRLTRAHQSTREPP